ncbi:MAG: ABC transporter substrate-binding protein [Paracoccaceae bacterium]
MLRWGVVSDIPSVDPNSYSYTFTIAVQRHLYEGLVRYNQDMQLEPALATSWQVTSPTTWEFKLRQGVTFHDGSPFTADDVIASLERLTDPTSPVKVLNAYRGSKKVDDYTVEIETTPNYPLLPNDLTTAMILDKEWMEEHDALLPTDVAKGVEGFASTHANGTGPFKLASRVPGQKTVFEANKDWWDTPVHNLDRVEMIPIASDATRLAALLSDQIDFTMAVPLQDIPRLDASGSIDLLKRPQTKTIFYFLNQGDKLYGSDLDSNPFQDVRVRQALNQAIDIEAIHNKIMRGLSQISGSIIAPEIPGHIAALDERLPYDPDKAQELLAEAGYPDGFDFTFVCETGAYTNGEELCQAVSAMWSRIGLKPHLDLGPSNIQYAKYENQEFDVGIMGWANEPPLDSLSILAQLVHTRTGSLGAFNFGGWVVPGADAMIEEAAQLAGDREKRLALQGAALEASVKDASFVPLHQEVAVWAIGPKVESVFLGPDSKPRLWYTVME